MICYHGSDVIVDSPRILDAKRPLDFGGGFYTTTSEIQAKNWAIKVSYRNNIIQKYINKYEFDKELALKTETVCDQILFHTDESLKYLKFCGVEEN